MKYNGYHSNEVTLEDTAMGSSKEYNMNVANGVLLGMKAIGKRSLYNIKTVDMFKLRFVDQPSNHRIRIDFGSSLAALASIRTWREILTIADKYGSPAALLKLRGRDKRVSG